MGKAVKSATKAVSGGIKTVGGAVSKISKGDISGGLGDLGSGAANMGLDIATGGNKGKVDALSGGLMTTTTNAARGNTADISKLGVIGGATLAGGPMAGFAANQVLAGGGSVFDAAAGVAMGMGAPSSLVNIGQSLGNNILGNGAPVSSIAPMSSDAQPPVMLSAPTGGGSNKTMMIAALAGGGFLILIIVLLVSRKK